MWFRMFALGVLCSVSLWAQEDARCVGDFFYTTFQNAESGAEWVLRGADERAELEVRLSRQDLYGEPDFYVAQLGLELEFRDLVSPEFSLHQAEFSVQAEVYVLREGPAFEVFFLTGNRPIVTGYLQRGWESFWNGRASHERTLLYSLLANTKWNPDPRCPELLQPENQWTLDGQLTHHTQARWDARVFFDSWMILETVISLDLRPDAAGELQFGGRASFHWTTDAKLTIDQKTRSHSNQGKGEIQLEAVSEH